VIIHTHLPQQRGVTLVELLVSIVIVAIAASAVLGALALTVKGSADPMIRHQSAAIAQAYLEEILLKPITDPDGIDGEVARIDFDDVDDYNGLNDIGASDQFGNPIGSLADYDVSVAVTPSAGLPAAPAADALRIDVNVVRATDINFTLSGYRLRY
jgi:MSHA pilin protein MshD